MYGYKNIVLSVSFSRITNKFILLLNWKDLLFHVESQNLYLAPQQQFQMGWERPKIHFYPSTIKIISCVSG